MNYSVQIKYIKFLEDKIRKIDSVFGLISKQLQDQNIDPNLVYLAALKDIRKHLRQQQ